MSDDIIKSLLESLTDEQKANLVNSLLETNDKKNTPEKGELPKQEEALPSQQEKDDNDFTMNRNSTTSKRRKETVKFKKNTWKDDGSEFSEIETPKVTRTPRNRKKPNMVTVECHVCGKEFKMNSSLVYGDYQRCNRCGGK